MNNTPDTIVAVDPASGPDETAILSTQPRRTPEQRDLARRIALRIAEMDGERRPREHLKMSHWGTTNSCGTVACIAGWTIIESGGDLSSCGYFDISSRAQGLLGLSDSEADVLFVTGPLTEGLVEYLPDVTPAQASAVLLHLAETDRVDWSVAGEA